MNSNGLHLHEKIVFRVPSPLAGEGQGEGKSSGDEAPQLKGKAP